MKYTHTVVGWLPPGLNGNDGLIRMHFSKRKLKLEECQLHLWDLKSRIRQTEELPLQVPVVITYERRSIRLMDWDNAGASFKLIGDALVKMGVLEDDSPKHIIELKTKQVKVKTRAEAGFHIEIELQHTRTGQ